MSRGQKVVCVTWEGHPRETPDEERQVLVIKMEIAVLRCVREWVAEENRVPEALMFRFEHRHHGFSHELLAWAVESKQIKE